MLNLLFPVVRNMVAERKFQATGLRPLRTMNAYERVLAVNKLFGDPTLMMALHVVSVNVLMIVFPFTKLMHAFTFAMARYYNGSIQGRKGAES